MPTVRLNIDKSVFIPKFYDQIFDYSHRWEFWMGGAGSGKSFSICQKLLIRAIQEPIRILVCRRYASTLRNSCFALYKEVIKKWKLTPYAKVNESDFRIRFPHNGSEIIFIGLDNEEKLLSMNDISTIHIEEAYEITRELAEQLSLRMRGNASNQQLILSWNPISQSSWLFDFSVENPPANSVFIHSTFRDNPFLNEDYVASIEELYTRNPQKARVYADGEWGVPYEGLVFKNWTIEEIDHMKLASEGLEHRAGADIGWVDPSAVVDTLYDRDNKTIYIFNEWYRSGAQVSEIADAIKDMHLDRVKLYVDSAEARTIQYLKNQRINAVGCAKGKDSVKAGIMFLQDHRLVVSPKCKNVIRELENFSYIKSKVTGEWTEDTTHEYSHSLDATRYAYSDIYTNKRVRTLDKSLLGL